MKYLLIFAVLLVTACSKQEQSGIGAVVFGAVAHAIAGKAID
jgi:hypothetical protein